MNEMLSQEEIDALLNKTSYEKEVTLSSEETDALGEIGNISMGTAATTLYALIKNKVTITTPNVDIIEAETISREYPLPFIGVKIFFTEGIEGVNLLLLKERDARIIADLMMGRDGSNPDKEIGEIHLSAISEAMNQMIGSSSTSLATMLGKSISISPPSIFKVDLSSEEASIDFFEQNQRFVKTSFRMVVGDLIDSEIMQLLPIDFAKKLVANLTGKTQDEEKSEQEENINDKISEENIVLDESKENKTENERVIQEEVKVQPVSLKSFEEDVQPGVKENIDLIRDVPLQVVVELGRTKKQIREILQFNSGTIVELDKLAGEPVDILVNGKFIAKGEVVVIDESFGVRITDIVHPSKRVASI